MVTLNNKIVNWTIKTIKLVLRLCVIKVEIKYMDGRQPRGWGHTTYNIRADKR